MYTLKELEKLQTLSIGQAEDLKIETMAFRVWLSRCTRKDGEAYSHKVTTEQHLKGRWVTRKRYKALSHKKIKGIKYSKVKNLLILYDIIKDIYCFYL